MPILGILIKCMAHWIWITEMNRFYWILHSTKNNETFIYKPKYTVIIQTKNHTSLDYLILRIQITYKDCIPNIENYVSPFAIKICISHGSTWTWSTQWTNPTATTNAFTSPIASTKTKCTTPIPCAQKLCCSWPNHPTAGTKAWRWGSRCWWSWLFLEVSKGSLCNQIQPKFALNSDVVETYIID